MLLPCNSPKHAVVQSQTCWSCSLCLGTPKRWEVWEKHTVLYNHSCPQPWGAVALWQLKTTTYFLAAVSSPTVSVATAHRLGHAPLTVLFRIEGPQWRCPISTYHTACRTKLVRTVLSPGIGTRLQQIVPVAALCLRFADVFNQPPMPDWCLWYPAITNGIWDALQLMWVSKALLSDLHQATPLKFPWVITVSQVPYCIFFLINCDIWWKVVTNFHINLWSSHSHPHIQY